MKTKFLFAFAAVTLALGALMPTTAKAGGYDDDYRYSGGYSGGGGGYREGYYTTRFVGYDRCGRPVYQKVWVPVCNPRPHCPPPQPICPPWGGGFRVEFGGRGHHHHCR